jgi:hypothetical protein
MEKSCENCMLIIMEPCVYKRLKECQNLEKYKPDYPALKQENAELKQQLEKLQNEKSAFELLYHTTERHFAEDTVKYQKRIEAVDQSLERACKVVALNRVHECPIESDCWSAHDCLCGDEVCIKRLMNHFEEAVQ